MGIPKRELFEDYYMDEFPEIARAYAKMKSPPEKEEETEYVGGEEFLS